MKNLLLALLLVSPFLLTAQSSGEISYKETLKLEIELPPEMEQFKDKIPSSQKFSKTLLFNSDATIYKDVEVSDEGDGGMDLSDGGGMQIKMEFDRPDDQTFTDLKTGKTIEKKDFMGKKFLVNGETKRIKWKITGEQKTVLDYTCQKAIFKDTSKTVIAWFTNQIPVSAGPSNYAGLPGMILEMDIDDGKTSIVATGVEFKEIEKEAMKMPKKGKKVSSEEFDKIVEAKMKEMQEEHGGNGNVIIQTRRQ